MPAENGESFPNIDKNRSEVNRIKGLVKADNLIFRGHDYDSPGQNDIDNKERELIMSFGLQGVETVDDLFNRTQAPGYNSEIAKEKLDILATAFYESIVESGRKEIVIAGSSSIEKQLSWARFSGRDKSNEENQSFSFMVAEKFRSNFGTEEKRNEITTTMEYLDFIKNSEYGKNGGLEEAAGQAYDNLKKIKPNVLNKKEMDAYAATVKYVSSLKYGEKTSAVENRELLEGIKKINEAAEKLTEGVKDINPKRKENDQNGEKNEGDNYEDIRNEIKGLDFDNSEQVLAYSRELLDYLENSNYSSDDINISGETTRLLNYILNKKIVDKVGKKEFKDIGDEIRARLALHDTAFYMAKASGGLSERSNNSIPNILEKLGEHDRFLTREVMRFFFDNNKDLDFTKAWNLLQEANFNYQQILRKAGVSEEKIGYKFIRTKDDKDPAITSDSFFGKKYINYEYDPKEEDKGIVFDYMIKELGGGEKARKALQLAEKMFIASGESSVVNVGFVNGDEFSEAIQFGRFREDDARPGKTKNSGPDVHRGWIKSLTPGWLRNFSGINDPDKPISADIIRNNLDYLEGKKDFYTYHSVIVGKKTGALKELLLSKKLEKPEEIVDIDYFRSKIDLFNKLDSKNKKSLRVFWVAGLLQSQMMNRNNLWDSDHISSLKRILTKESLTLKGQPAEYFLTKEEWDWMAKAINLKKYFAVDFMADVVGDMFKMKRKR
ncbi:MAG: hypothetical protein PHE32_00600 [Candidatus Shapirobacteria bacterium]|nr:hypothetical protein [Candidatus Shapirobacteria bacterium]MDD4410196.1 hypothetical protein [Candidatus Shapirobacteria bacterium]